MTRCRSNSSSTCSTTSPNNHLSRRSRERVKGRGSALTDRAQPLAQRLELAGQGGGYPSVEGLEELLRVVDLGEERVRVDREQLLPVALGQFETVEVDAGLGRQ